MKVKAKYQLAYKGVIYYCGDTFELSEEDFDKFKNDIIVVVDKAKSFRNPTTKQVVKAKTK